MLLLLVSSGMSHGVNITLLPLSKRGRGTYLDHPMAAVC